MPEKKQNTLPSYLVLEFMKNFGTSKIFLHLHSLFKHKDDQSTVIHYNLAVFLTFEKSRKIIRQKQDQFVAQMVQKIQLQSQLLLSSKYDPTIVHKIQFSEIQKFIELLNARNVQFNYLKLSLQNMQDLCSLSGKQKKNLGQKIRKMARHLQNFQKKLLHMLRYYQSKYSINFSRKLNKSYVQLSEENTNQLQQKHQDYLIDRVIKAQQSETKQDFFKNQRPKSVRKIGIDDLQKRETAQKYKTEIKSLKSKYSMLNCKTDSSFHTKESCKFQRPNRDRFNSLVKISHIDFLNQKCAIDFGLEKQEKTEVVQTNFTDNQTRLSDMKFSIRLTTQKKNSKLNTSFSIFDKTNHKSSFFKNSNSKFCNQALNVSVGNNIVNEQIIIQKNRRKSSFLKKRGSKKESFKSSEPHIVKKPNYSVYKQTNLTVQVHNIKSVNVRNSRESLKFQQKNKRKSYLIRKSVTEANNETQNYESTQQFDGQLVNTQCQPNNQTENILDQQIIQDDSDYGGGQNKKYSKTNKKKNRRKDFSKKIIDVEDQSNQIQTSNNMQRTSILRQPERKQRGPSRTSIFRSSGYVPKKNVQKIGKTKFQNLNRNKQEAQNKQLNSDSNIEIGTRKTIKNKFMQKQRMKKQNIIKGSDFALTLKDLLGLNQQITSQAKNDQLCEYPNYMFDMMRLKYDLKSKKAESQNDSQDYLSKYFKPKLRALDIEVCFREKIRKYPIEDSTMFDFNSKIIKGFNRLGQKQLSSKAYSHDFPGLQDII